MKILKIPRDKDFYLGIPLVTQSKTGTQSSLDLSEFSELPIVTLRSIYGERYLPVVSAHVDTILKGNVLVAKVRPETDKMTTSSYAVDLDGYLEDIHVMGAVPCTVQLVRNTEQSNVTPVDYSKTDATPYYELDATIIGNCKKTDPDYKKDEHDDALKAIDAQLHRNEEKINAEILRAEAAEKELKEETETVTTDKIEDEAITYDKLDENVRAVIKAATGVDTDILKTLSEKYVKPEDGIPLSDLAEDVSTAISNAGKADEVTLTKDEETSEMSVKDGGVTYAKLSSEVADDIDKLMKNAFPLVATVNINPTALQEKGTTATVTITWSATVEGRTVTASCSINNTAQAGTTFSENISDTKSYIVALTAEGRTTKVTKSVTFVYPIYVGFNASTEYASGLESNLTKQGLRSSLGTLSVTSSNDSTSKYFWILSPYAMSHVKTSGIDTIGDFIHSTPTINGTTYHAYRLSKASAVGSFTFEIS